MMDKQYNIGDGEKRHVFAWLLFPLALFPLAALLTYDWRAIDTLNSPPIHSSNWIGKLGDLFAYHGYMLFGLAIWVVPVICIIASLCIILGRYMRPGRRELWLFVFLLSTSCLFQVIGSHGGSVEALIRHINIPNAGGAVGYLLMTRCLSPLISDFASSVVAVIVMIIAFIAAIGIRNFVAFFYALYRWAMIGRYSVAHTPSADAAQGENFNGNFSAATQDPVESAFQAMMRAKEEARRQREKEKAEIKAQKQAEKERVRAEKAAAKEAARAAKLAQRAESPAPSADAAAATPSQSAVLASNDPVSPADKGPYILPSLSLLNPLKKSAADHGNVNEMCTRLISTLKLFNVDASLSYTVQGPVVTKYAITLAPGTRYSVVTSISDNLMGALHAKSLRIEAPIPGEDCVGIEVPNRTSVGISFREIIESNTWRNFKGQLPLLFGKDAAGNDLIADLAKMPHMLVAGATGQGKSVCLNSIINGLLMTKTPDQLKFIMVDPKSVEFTSYASIPHLLVPVITDNNKASGALRWAVAEMEKRLKMFARARVRNIADFNNRPQFTQTNMFGDDSPVGSDMPKTVPYIVIIIDEVADLMAACAKEVTPNIARLTAKARAAGIHVILATQRPDAKVITGTIKANIPGRVAFKTATAIDSRTILDDGGAENLIGKGDMLFRTAEGLLIRAQGAWISDEEIDRITKFIEEHSNVQFDDGFRKKLNKIKETSLEDDDEDDESESTESAQEMREKVKAEASATDFKKAIECIINTNRASTSHFQRKLGWGYNHAAKIIDMLEEEGVVGPQSGAGPRQIIMDQQQLMELFNGDGGDVKDTQSVESEEVDLFTEVQ
jgi:S-DNA-T family DNA segregation ATPase FtsK/SpoIIIE